MDKKGSLHSPARSHKVWMKLSAHSGEHLGLKLAYATSPSPNVSVSSYNGRKFHVGLRKSLSTWSRSYKSNEILDIVL